MLQQGGTTLPLERPSRSLVHGRNGVVCSVSPLAATTGIKVLLDGGNAFDAAIAIAAVETVTLPSKCTLGADAFAVLYQASTQKLISINSSGAAPTGATTAYLSSKGYDRVPRDGPLSITVPGEVDAWAEVHQRFCTIPFDRLLEPAIGYAEGGYPITARIGPEFTTFAGELAEIPASREVFVKGNVPYAEGDVLVQKDLAKTLKRVATGGAEEFYRGGLAKDMVKALQRAGGLFTEEDFANHLCEVHEPPLSTTYRGYTVYQTSVPSQGYMLLEMLNTLEGFDLSSLGHNTAESIHLMVEAKKLAYSSRNKHAGDLRFVDWPLERFISKEYAEEQRRLIDLDRAGANVGQPIATPGDGDTSYFCVTDGFGNCVSFIHSVAKPFGSNFVAEGTGVLFNNRGGNFRFEEGHPNTIAPGKRPMHTINCYMVFKGGVPVIVGGTPGTDYQPQGGIQMLTGVIDFGLGLQDAIDAPRWYSIPGTYPKFVDDPYELLLEHDMPQETVRGLEAKGHKISYSDGNPFGRVQLIGLDHQRKIMTGASDPRADGHAMGI